MVAVGAVSKQSKSAYDSVAIAASTFADDFVFPSRGLAVNNFSHSQRA
jgi:hypothetical protein